MSAKRLTHPFFALWSTFDLWFFDSIFLRWEWHPSVVYLSFTFRSVIDKSISKRLSLSISFRQSSITTNLLYLHDDFHPIDCFSIDYHWFRRRSCWQGVSWLWICEDTWKLWIYMFTWQGCMWKRQKMLLSYRTTMWPSLYCTKRQCEKNRSMSIIYFRKR